MTTVAAPAFSIHDFLRQEAAKDLLRFSTAGSVDDGKSTLIGRLLYDTQSVYEDQVRSIEGKGTTAPGQLDFALLTDGLRAEREQGITIDVAYRYFSTAKRKFIIADTPGHEQYTRNMATGASTADAAVVLIDARKGVLVQSRRHAYIASLLRVRHILVAVNKMDLIDYDEGAFRAIERDFRAVLDQISADTGNAVEAVFIPLSALAGDNVVHCTNAMPWYTGPSLLELLESLPPAQNAHAAPFRLAVQRVIRPDHTFRGFAGQIASGTVRPGDEIVALPSGRSAKISRIVTWDGDLQEASAPLSVTLVLDRELDISRGDLIAAKSVPAVVAHRLEASIVWMSQRPLSAERRHIVKHASHTVPARIASIDARVDVTSLHREPAAKLELNHIGSVTLDLLRPIAFDSYAANRSTGAFILIDPEDNSTVAAGMISAAIPSTKSADSDSEEIVWGPVTAGERQSRWGHRGGVLELSGPAALIDAIERSLFTIGAVTARMDAESEEFLLHPQLLDLITESQTRAGLLTLLVRIQEDAALTAHTSGQSIEAQSLTLDAAEPTSAIAAVHRLLREANVLISPERSGL
jgi:sulfate adenylyltransferase subunit 1